MSDDAAGTDVVVDRDVMVAMRDGVRLATDVYRPAPRPERSAAPLPVVLSRTPYDKTEADDGAGWARRFAREGYVAVVQDCRGCFRSEGEVDFLFPEADDGYDTVAWIRRQPWCDGRVGTLGTSWSGWAQTALAAAGAEGVAAMVPVMSGADGRTSSIRHGGAMELRWLAWAFWHSAANTQAELVARPWVTSALTGGPPFGELLRRWPPRPGTTQLGDAAPAYERWALELLAHGDDDEYWRHPSVAPVAHLDTFTDAPTLLVGGWYDSYTRGTLELYQALSATKRGPVKVVVGPWTHGQLEQPFAGDVWFGADAVFDGDAVHRRWFDRWLRDLPNGADDDSPVRIFVMGGGSGRPGPGGRLHHGGRWREEASWPLARTRYTPFHLHADGSLDRRAPDLPEASTTFRFDPSEPVPTIGGNVSSLAEIVPPPAGVDPRLVPADDRNRDLVPPGGFDQMERADVFGCSPPYLPLATRADVLVFRTAPLEEALEVTGPVEVTLWVATTALDTDITAKLIDVYPPSPWYPRGYALNLTDSIVRLRYRNDARAPVETTPGEVVEVLVTLYPTSNVFAAGHRIRLDISSSNFPRFDVNPNTGEPLGRERGRVIAKTTVFHDSARPSRIVLPVVPTG